MIGHPCDPCLRACAPPTVGPWRRRWASPAFVLQSFGLLGRQHSWPSRPVSPFSHGIPALTRKFLLLLFSPNTNWNIAPQRVNDIRSWKILDKIHYSNFQLKIRRIKHNLIIKLITWMDGKSRDKSIKTINMSLEVVYCSTTLSNYGPIRLKIFVSQF